MKDLDVIVFDLDGTLAESKSPLDIEMAELLGKLLSKYKVAIVSGASRIQFDKQFFPNFSCSAEQLHNLYLLPTNGASFYIYKKGEWGLVYQLLLSPDEIKQIMSALDSALQEGKYTKPEKTFGEIIENRGSQITFSGCGMEAPLSVKKEWDPDRKKREPIYTILTRLLPNFSISMSATTSIDITKAGIDKAYGLERLMEHIDCPKNRLLYVGDALFPGGNDASVLRLAIQTQKVDSVLNAKVFIRELLEDRR